MTRQEVLASYARPYARGILAAYRTRYLPALVALIVALAAASAVFDLFGGLAILTLEATILWAAWVTLAAIVGVRRETVEWRDDDHELGRVRSRRPHAGDADAELAHEEYAVSVDDDGRLLTWCFRPLAALDEPARDEALVCGTPRYAGRLVDRRTFDPDAALAAEQLADAQEDAAQRELEAIDALRAAIVDAERARELEAETRSTGAALRGATGQSRD